MIILESRTISKFQCWLITLSERQVSRPSTPINVSDFSINNFINPATGGAQTKANHNIEISANIRVNSTLLYNHWQSYQLTCSTFSTFSSMLTPLSVVFHLYMATIIHDLSIVLSVQALEKVFSIRAILLY